MVGSGSRSHNLPGDDMIIHSHLFPEQPEYGGPESAADVRLGRQRVVEEADLERQQSVLAEVDTLDDGVLFPIPDVHTLTI